jgi:hypothetical protein
MQILGIIFTNKNIILVYLPKTGVKNHRKEGLIMLFNRQDVPNDPKTEPTNPQPNNPDTNPDTTTTK